LSYWQDTNREEAVRSEATFAEASVVSELQPAIKAPTSIIPPGDGTLMARTAATEVEVYVTPGGELQQVLIKEVLVYNENNLFAFSVIGHTEDGWLEVMLPVRPNQSTGWVRAEGMGLYWRPHEVTIDLSRGELCSSTYGIAVLDATCFSVGLGKTSTPTPIGVYYITERIDLIDDEGFFGPLQLVISAFSETGETALGGNGEIAIHGTSVPSSVGAYQSLGCIRMYNADIIKLVGFGLKTGTVVTIVP